MDSGDIEQLGVKFHFLEEGIAEIKAGNARLVQETQDTQDKIKEIVGQNHIDLKAMTDDYMTHRVEMSAKSTQKELQERLALIQAQEKIIQSSVSNISEKESALKPLREDAEKIEEMMTKTKDHLAGIKSAFKEFQADSGISGQSLAEIGSIGGLIALAFTAMGEMSRYSRNVSIAEAQGGQILNSEQTAKFADYTKSLTNVGGMNLSEQEANQLVGGLLGIRGVGAGDIQKVMGVKGNETDTFGERVAKMGESIGEGPTGAVGMTKIMMDHLQIPMNKVESEFDKLRKTSEALGDAHHEYLHAVLETADSMRIYNVSMQTTSDVLATFWDRIQKHEISMDQVTGLLKLGATENVGQLAYGGLLAAQKGSPALRGALAGKNALQQADVMQRVLEGSYGANPEEQRRLQEDALQLYGQEALGAGPDRVTQAMMFKTLTGRDILGSMRADQQEDFLKDIASGKMTDFDKKHMENRQTKTLDDLADAVNNFHDPINQVIHLLKDIAQVVGGAVLMIAGKLTGHPDMGNMGEQLVSGNIEEFVTLLGGKPTGLHLEQLPASVRHIAQTREAVSTLQEQYASAHAAHGYGVDFEHGGTKFFQAGKDTAEEFSFNGHFYLHYSDGHIEEIVEKVTAKKAKAGARKGGF